MIKEALMDFPLWRKRDKMAKKEEEEYLKNAPSPTVRTVNVQPQMQPQAQALPLPPPYETPPMQMQQQPIQPQMQQQPQPQMQPQAQQPTQQEVTIEYVIVDTHKRLMLLEKDLNALYGRVGILTDEVRELVGLLKSR